MRFESPKMCKNAFAAGALPQTQLGSLQRSLRPPSYWGEEWGREMKRKGRRRERRERGEIGATWGRLLLPGAEGGHTPLISAILIQTELKVGALRSILQFVELLSK